MTTTRGDALDALSTVQATRAELAQSVSCPPWRHALFGAIAGVYVSAPAAGYPGMLYVWVGVMVAIALIVRADRRRMGVFINGYRRGKTLPHTISLVVGLIGLCMVGVWFSEERGLHWVPLAFGAAAVPLAMIASVWWQRTFQREMGMTA